MRLRRPLLALLGAALLVLGGCAAKPAKVSEGAGVEVLRYASPYGPGHPFSRADITWMKWVEANSGGRIKVQPFWGGALISSDQSVIELKHGIADVALVTPIYMRSGMRLIKVQSGFYSGVRTIPGQVAVYRCLQAAFPAYTTELDGVHVLAIQGGNLPGVITRTRPVRSLEDLRGLRLRAPTELVEVLQKLGVDVVTMPMGEVYSSISKGVIDGVVAPADTIKTLHFNEVAKHFSTLEVPRGAYAARAISEKRWRALAPDLQAVLTRSEAVWEDALAKEISQANVAGMTFGKTHGIQVTQIDPAEQARFLAIDDLTALENARKLRRVHGIDAEPVFHKAHELIARGEPVTSCDATQPPPA